jgi:hypothetical protein
MARAKKRVRDVPFALRLPPALYERVKAEAEREEDSINSLVVRAVARMYAQDKAQEVSPGNMKPHTVPAW